MRQITRAPLWNFGFLLCLGAILLGYQNCSREHFVESSSAPPVNYSLSNTTAFSCQTVVTLTAPTDGSVLNVPARDASGTCYAIQLVSTVTYPTSSTNTAIDAEVVSRNHDTWSGNHNPYTLGKALLNFQVNDARALYLAGAADSKTDIQVDNFILVGLFATSHTSFAVSDYQAYGTADSPVLDAQSSATNYILLQNQQVPLTPFESGGISSINPLALQGEVTTSTPTTLDLRALDCGGQGYSSNIYLVFQ